MERKTNRLIIFPGNFLPHSGGLETNVDEFAKYLSRKGYQITIFTPGVAGGKERETIHKNVKVIRYPAFEIVRNFPFPKFWHYKFYTMYFGLRRRDYDFVMTRTRFFSNSTLGLIFAKFRFSRLPLIHVEHGSSYVTVESKFTSAIAKFYDRTFGRLLFASADRVTAISKGSERFVKREFLPKKKVEMIYRGVDFEIYNNKSDKATDKEFKGKVKFLFVGRLFKWKGVIQSIKAYQSLPKDLQSQSVLLVIGDGEDLDRLMKESGLMLNNGIYFYKKQSFERAIDITKSCDIYVHSSYPGGALSNSLLQAMYLGKAVIASPNEGGNEVVNEKNGIALKDNSVSEIRNAMAKLIKDKKRRESYGKEAHMYIKKNFDWERNIKAYEAIFNELRKR